MAARPTMLYGLEYRAMKKQNVKRSNVAKVRMFRCMSGKLRKDWIRNKDIRDNPGLMPIEGKMRENSLR